MNRLTPEGLILQNMPLDGNFLVNLVDRFGVNERKIKEVLAALIKRGLPQDQYQRIFRNYLARTGAPNPEREIFYMNLWHDVKDGKI
jgi:hypothetical protein